MRYFYIIYPDISTATTATMVTLYTRDTFLKFHRSALHMPPLELMGMESVKCVIENGKWGQWRISCTTRLRYLQTQANRLQTPFGARHESTGFCGWVSSTSQSISPTGKRLVHIPNRKGVNPYPQLERGWSITPTGNGPCKKRGLGLLSKNGPKRCPER